MANFWKFQYLLIALVAALAFTAAPVLVVQRHVTLPPAYELKSQHPFADTTQLTVPKQAGERSHGAKLTARVVGASFLYLAAKFGLHPFLPATLFGLVFLFAGIQIGYSLSKDRLTALFIGLTFAGLYAVSACLSMNASPKPFDGIAIGLIALTLIAYDGSILLFGGLAFLSCWTDERALVSMACIGCFSYFLPDNGNRILNRQILALVGAATLYFLTRLLAGYVLHWAPADLHGVGMTPVLSAQYLPLAAWSCFEGAWLILVLAAAALFKSRRYYAAGCFLALTLAVVGSCVLVEDISRTSSFAYPLIATALAILVGQKTWTLRELRTVTGSAAVVSLLAPNYEIWLGHASTWLPAWPYFILSR